MHTSKRKHVETEQHTSKSRRVNHEVPALMVRKPTHVKSDKSNNMKDMSKMPEEPLQLHNDKALFDHSGIYDDVRNDPSTYIIKTRNLPDSMNEEITKFTDTHTYIQIQIIPPLIEDDMETISQVHVYWKDSKKLNTHKDLIQIPSLAWLNDMQKKFFYCEWVYVIKKRDKWIILGLADMYKYFKYPDSEFVETFIKANTKRTTESIMPIIPPQLYNVYMSNTQVPFYETMSSSLAAACKSAPTFNQMFICRPPVANWPNIYGDNLNMIPSIKSIDNPEEYWRAVAIVVLCGLHELGIVELGDLSDSEDENDDDDTNDNDND
jgi:hypothetical protein